MEGIDLNKISVSKKQTSEENKNGLMAFLNKDISMGTKQFPDKKKEAFYSELALLLDAGLEIRFVLELIESDEQNKADKSMLTEIKKQVIKGKDFSEALRESGRFSDYEYYSLKIGESSGKTLDVLEQLRKYFEKKIKQRRQMLDVITYPLIVIGVAIAAVAFMLGFVIPAFAGIFKRFDVELPLLTRFFMDLSESFGFYFLVFILFIGGLVLFYKANSKKEWMRRGVSSFVLKIPAIGNLVQLNYLARFCQMMALLSAAKVTITDTMDMVKKMISYYPIEKSMEEMDTDVSVKGHLLSKSMEKHKIYPRKMIYLIRAAEEVNKTDKVFSRLAEQYSEEVEHKSKLVATIVQQVLIVLVGILVGFILVAMYLPMFSLSQIVH